MPGESFAVFIFVEAQAIVETDRHVILDAHTGGSDQFLIEIIGEWTQVGLQ